MQENIEGKVVVITGASSGIGEETARLLARKGAKVVLGARRIDKLETIVSQIRSDGGDAECMKMDVTLAEEVKNLAMKANRSFGKVDVMINNAGLMAIAPMAECNVDEWDKMIDINIKGVLYGVASCLPIFQKQNYGHFINLSSVAGIKVFSPGGTVYSGTKFAVRAISEGLRNEVGGNIRVTSIEPGLVKSELMYGSTHKESSEVVKQFYQDAIPTESVSNAILYAIEQPMNVDINEIVLRPTIQEF